MIWLWMPQNCLLSYGAFMSMTGRGSAPSMR